MKLVELRTLAVEAVKIVRFARFHDNRGYFTEHYRRSDFKNTLAADILDGLEFVQANESYSRKGTLRGLHLQWNPYVGKLVRTLTGRMVDIVLDIRKGSPTFGKILLHDMTANRDADFQEWIWVPPGFAHGNFFPEDTLIEYFCTGEYNPNCEAGISPLADDIDWALCDRNLRRLFEQTVASGVLMSEKDKNGFSLSAWQKDERSNNFIYGRL